MPCTVIEGGGNELMSAAESADGRLDLDLKTPLRRGRVLIVDDLPQNCLLLGLYCDRFGLAHESAANGYEALDAVRSGRFAVVLMDILMPRMDGMTATRAIRALPAPLCDIPIIAVSTAASPGEVSIYLACGMTDVVAKPVVASRLAEAVSAVLARKPGRARRRRAA
jgi:CheY-like chemotaxis protein